MKFSSWVMRKAANLSYFWGPLILLVGMLILTFAGHAAGLDPLKEYRYCGEPTRNADGTITRRSDVLTAFRKLHPCPVTGKTTGACPDWAIDHVIPRACGGCDVVSNLQWLPFRLKGSKDGKDRFERLIYCTPMQTVK